MNGYLDGKRALVTGGTKGAGVAVVSVLREAGARCLPLPEATLAYAAASSLLRVCERSTQASGGSSRVAADHLPESGVDQIAPAALDRAVPGLFGPCECN
jgi:NAD(P)-dependent dehydrogenase (short-subunit alcohol dehydrogenase family)